MAVGDLMTENCMRAGACKWGRPTTHCMSLLPGSVKEFGEERFWDRFFTKLGADTFEWYGEWPHVEHFLRAACSPSHRILVVGCGNSELGSCMHDAGFQNIVSIDFSDVVIREMQRKNARRAGMQFLRMDMLRMTFPDASFDVVLDKACLDALLTDGSPEVVEKARAMMAEVERVLAPAGQYLCISLLQSHILEHLLGTFVGRYAFSIESFTAGNESELCPFFIRATKVAAGSEAAVTVRRPLPRQPRAPTHCHCVAMAGRVGVRSSRMPWGGRTGGHATAGAGPARRWRLRRGRGCCCGGARFARSDRAD